MAELDHTVEADQRAHQSLTDGEGISSVPTPVLPMDADDDPLSDPK